MFKITWVFFCSIPYFCTFLKIRLKRSVNLPWLKKYWWVQLRSLSKLMHRTLYLVHCSLSLPLFLFLSFCACVCVCVCVCVYFLLQQRLLLTKQNNKCNARDQVSDSIVRKYFCIENLYCHVIDNHSRDL